MSIRNRRKGIIIGIVATTLFHGIFVVLILFERYAIGDLLFKPDVNTLYLEQYVEEYKKDKGKIIDDVIKEIHPQKIKTPIIHEEETKDLNKKVDIFTAKKDSVEDQTEQQSDSLALNTDTLDYWNLVYGAGKGGAGGTSDSSKFLIATEMPKFQGKEMNAFGIWFQQHLNLPQDVGFIKNRITLVFLIDRDGSVKDVKAINCANQNIEKEIYRVLRLTPNFTPAKRNGWPMKLRFQMIININ